MYGRQFATMAGMILLSFLMLGASFATLSYQYAIQEKQDSMGRSANIIAAYTSEYINANGQYSWQDMGFQGQLSVLALATDTHVMVSTAQGTVVYATDGANELLELESRSIPTQIVSEVVRGSFVGATTLGGMYERPRYLVALPIQSGATLQGLVLVSCEASEISSMWQDISSLFLITATAVILIAAIISSVTSMRQSKPIKEIAAAARQFGHGELSVRVDVGHRRDEVGELAEAFNAMADSLSKSEQRRSEFLQVIVSETRRLSRLVRSMLDLSRLQSDERAAQQQFDICETMLRVLVSLENKINAKHLNVDAHLPDDPVQVWGDQDAITQVCYNLLDNAAKFSPENGPLRISITTKSSKAYISISNEGQAISPEELPLIFDRFHKTDHSRSADRDGVGLGLYIVKTILNSHKENITCTSEDGKTTFTFTLTLA